MSYDLYLLRKTRLATIRVQHTNAWRSKRSANRHRTRSANSASLRWCRRVPTR